MSKSKHTPGPWGVSQTTRGTTRIHSMEDGDMLCLLRARPERGANARLIAAAPELLKAAKGLLKYIMDEWPPTKDAEVLRIESYRRAIRKAEGGA